MQAAIATAVAVADRKDDSPSPYCWYHRNFGKRVVKCRGPCTWVPGRRQPAVSRPQHGGTPNPGRRDDDGRRNDGSLSSYCYYHKKFGKKAVKCQNPCTWVPGN